MSFMSTSGTSALTINSFSVSRMSTGGIHGRPFGSLKSRFTVSWNTRRPVGKVSNSENGVYLMRDIFLLPPGICFQSQYIICFDGCQVPAAKCCYTIETKHFLLKPGDFHWSGLLTCNRVRYARCNPSTGVLRGRPE